MSADDLVANDVTKLVFAGPTGAGKTTAIAAIADAPPVSTEMPLTGGGQAGKTCTTVALDFASVRLDGDATLLLYGMPGQDHYDFMRPILLDGALGIVLVVAATADDPAADCATWLRALRALDASLPFVVGVTQTDRAPAFDIARIRAVLRAERLSAPIFTVDARDREQVSQLVRVLLLSLGA